MTAAYTKYPFFFLLCIIIQVKYSPDTNKPVISIFGVDIRQIFIGSGGR